MYNTSKASSRELVVHLLGGTTLSYVVHGDCVCGTTVGVREEQKYL